MDSTTYFYVAQQAGDGFVGMYMLGDIRRQLAAGQLQESHHATESDGRSFVEFRKSATGNWRTLAELFQEQPVRDALTRATAVATPAPPAAPLGKTGRPMGIMARIVLSAVTVIVGIGLMVGLVALVVTIRNAVVEARQREIRDVQAKVMASVLKDWGKAQGDAWRQDREEADRRAAEDRERIRDAIGEVYFVPRAIDVFTTGGTHPLQSIIVIRGVVDDQRQVELIKGAVEKVKVSTEIQWRLTTRR